MGNRVIVNPASPCPCPHRVYFLVHVVQEEGVGCKLQDCPSQSQQPPREAPASRDGVMIGTRRVSQCDQEMKSPGCPSAGRMQSSHDTVAGTRAGFLQDSEEGGRARLCLQKAGAKSTRFMKCFMVKQ